MNFLTPYWEHPACVKCAGCGEPLTLTMSSSVDPAATLHGRCWPEWKRNQRKETL